MRRSDAVRRHRRAVAVVAGLAGVIVVLLHSVVPWAEGIYQDRGIEPTVWASLIFEVSRVVVDRILLVLLLVASLIGLLWTSFGTLDRGERSRA